MLKQRIHEGLNYVQKWRREGKYPQTLARSDKQGNLYDEAVMQIPMPKAGRTWLRLAKSKAVV